MDIAQIGKEGEQIARELFYKKMKIKRLFQADWVIFKDKWYLAEVKHQDRFIKGYVDNVYCDIEGHGLPIIQVQTRLKFYEDTGIRCLFFVVEKPSKQIYWQWLDVLEQGKYFDTPIRKRRVYDINSFVNLK